jgi:N utilization substance protein B
MALKFLFCQEFAPEGNENLSLREKMTMFQSSFKAPSAVWKFAWEILSHVESHQTEIDSKIRAHLINWTMERLSLTDKNILRIAIAEMLYMETPPKVALNEAVDLGRKYSSSESASFVNGLLDKILISDCE